MNTKNYTRITYNRKMAKKPANKTNNQKTKKTYTMNTFK